MTALLATVPFDFHTEDSDIGRRLIHDYALDVTRLPAVIQHDGTVLYQPSIRDLGRAHGVHVQPAAPSYDLVVLGAGAAGLAAAVYGASEGLNTLVLESVGSVDSYLSDLARLAGQA